jgi:hypothetical protein
MSYDVDFVFALYIFNVAFSDDQFALVVLVALQAEA